MYDILQISFVSSPAWSVDIITSGSLIWDFHITGVNGEGSRLSSHILNYLH